MTLPSVPFTPGCTHLGTITPVTEGGGVLTGECSRCFARPPRYQIIYADPPWEHRNGGRGAAKNHYDVTATTRLEDLPVAQLADDNALLFMWVTRAMVPDALALGAAWGFTFKTTVFTWIKRNPSGKMPIGGGFWTRANPEYVYLFTRGKNYPRRVNLGTPEIVEADVIEARRGEHSAKPIEVRNRIDQLMGPEPARIELFAREAAPGWHAWGNEVYPDVEMDWYQP